MDREFLNSLETNGAEIIRLETENAKLKQDIVIMVEKAADKSLAGYRELGAKLADRERVIDELEAALARYRWVPAGEGLPDTNRKVSTTNKRRVWDDRYYPSKEYWKNSTDGVVEYWREIDLPE